MVSINEAEEMLNELVCDLPQGIFDSLSGGINLLEDYKLSPHAKKNNLYILGEYKTGRSLGRYIVIYYGSLVRVYGHLGEKAFKNRLKKVLHHELTHHLEALAGEKDLEIDDARQIQAYLKKHED
ncbi:MAG: metallopeptidase family protein [Clostridiales bacterium]|nr:metallopeptidase family protein [Clostridiales bacterium]